jgi:MtN3 and saliva related transmembrane protein
MRQPTVRGSQVNRIDWIGWAASATLLATLVWQVRKEWRAKDLGGVSSLLFIGQMAASAGFIVYSVAVHNWVFVVSNVLIATTALVGQILFLIKRKRFERRPHSS